MSVVILKMVSKKGISSRARVEVSAPLMRPVAIWRSMSSVVRPYRHGRHRHAAERRRGLPAHRGHGAGARVSGGER